jgi:hypothetical protein
MPSRPTRSILERVSSHDARNPRFPYGLNVADGPRRAVRASRGEEGARRLGRAGPRRRSCFGARSGSLVDASVILIGRNPRVVTGVRSELGDCDVSEP